MATLHAFLGGLRVASPPYSDDNISYVYQLSVDVIILDEDDVVLIPRDGTDPTQGLLTLTSTTAVEHDDDTAGLRAKALMDLRAYYPQIETTDTVVEHWLDDLGA